MSKGKSVARGGKMMFSLVIATVGRTGELNRFLEHLDKQTYRDFELIVVDQNPDNCLVPILGPFQEQFPILHLRSEKGLSRARNVGLKHISGDIVAFPDDDCWYPESLLDSVARFFQQNPNVDGLTGRAIDEKGRPSGGRWDKTPGPINRFNIWKKGISITIFLKKYVVDQVGVFDEDLGVGAGTLWGSSEEIDYLLRALELGFRIYYNPNVVVYHPQHVKRYNSQAFSRAYSYGAGIGRVLRKHRYPLWFVLYEWARSGGGGLISLLKGRLGKARFHLSALHGKVVGWGYSGGLKDG
mgnify:CR=1 FL=1